MRMSTSLLLILALLAGCDGRKPPATSRARESASEWRFTYDMHYLLGVRDPSAPNGELWLWLLSNEQPAQEFPERLAEQMSAGADSNSSALLGRKDRFDDDLNNMVQGVLDASRFRVGPGERDILIESNVVRWLNVSAEITADDLQWIGRMDGLKGLRIAHADLRGADFRQLQHLVNLQWLCLQWVKLNPRDCETLPSLPVLQTLALEGSYFNDNAMNVLNQFPKLQSLDVSHSAVGDIGIRYIAQHAPHLEYLNLYRTQATANSVNDLSRLDDLQLLGIGLTPLTPSVNYNQAVQMLERNLPKCNVDYRD